LLAVDKIRPVLVARTLPVAKAKQEVSMAKIDLDSLNIEEFALLRDRTIEKLAEKVAAGHDQNLGLELGAKCRRSPMT
jgi:hypothetical protein